MFGALIEMAATTGQDRAWIDALVLARENANDSADWVLEIATEVSRRLRKRKSFQLGSESEAFFRALGTDARAGAADESASLEFRRLCVSFLGATSLDREANLRVLESVFDSRSPVEIQRAAVHALSESLERSKLPSRFLSRWTSVTPTIRGEMLDLLLGRTEWCLAVLKAIEQSDIASSQFDARRQQQLTTHSDRTVAELAKRVFSASSPPARSELIAKYLDVAKGGGDVAAGRAIFRKKCANCHRLEGVGKPVGPDLTALTNRSDTALATALLAPNASVEDKYLEYLVLLDDGRQVRGMLMGETATSITLLEAEGRTREVLRREIDTLKSSGKSLMPEGLEKEVNATDAAHLFHYLRSSRPPHKSFPGNKPRTVTARDDGSIHLFATEGRIYGPSVVLEERYRNLGFWASSDDRVEWTLNVPASGKYRVTIDYACDNSVAGDRCMAQSAGQSVGGVVEGTSGWDNYRRKTLGIIELEAGVTELVFRSDGRVSQFLLDLRGVILSPQSE